MKLGCIDLLLKDALKWVYRKELRVFGYGVNGNWGDMEDM